MKTAAEFRNIGNAVRTPSTGHRKHASGSRVPADVRPVLPAYPSASPQLASTRSPSPVCHGIIGTVEIEFFGEPSITFVE